MFNIDSAIQGWRNELARESALAARDLDELEDHLFSAYEAELENGIDPERAFEIARDDIGAIAELTEEFGKVDSATWRRFVAAGWAMFVLAFLLPVHRDGITLFDGSWDIGAIPGIEALYFAISGEFGLVGFLSALTNGLMGLTLFRSAAKDRSHTIVLAGIMLAAAFLNLYWLTEGLPDLRIGFFMWWSSFASVATGYVLRAKELSETSPIIQPS